MLVFVLFLLALFKLNDPSNPHLEICPTETIIRGTHLYRKIFSYTLVKIIIIGTHVHVPHGEMAKIHCNSFHCLF